MTTAPAYTDEHVRTGAVRQFPEFKTLENRFRGYTVVIDTPEFTPVCPKSGLRDAGVITLPYMPGERCISLKSFNEDPVQESRRDPEWAEVRGDSRPRGGPSAVVTARWPRPANTR